MQRVSYEEAKVLCFSKENQAENLTTGLKALKALVEQKKEDAPKAAYLISIIHLLGLLEEKPDDEYYIALFEPLELTSKQKEILRDGLNWLKQSYSLGYEAATLLLGQIYIQEDRDHELPILLDGTEVGTLKIWDEQMVDRMYASHLLQQIGEKNAVAAKILNELALDYFAFLNNPDLHESFGLEYALERDKAQEGMIYTEADMELRQAKNNLRSEFNMQEESDKKNQNELYNKIFSLTQTFAGKGAFFANNYLMMIYHDEDKILTESIPTFKPNLKKAAIYEKRVWEARKLGCENSIRWAENALRLQCKDSLSTEQIEAVRRTLLLYATLRAKGLNAEKAGLKVQEVLKKIKLHCRCGCDAALYDKLRENTRGSSGLLSSVYHFATNRVNNVTGIFSPSSNNSSTLWRQTPINLSGISKDEDDLPQFKI